MNTLCLKCKKPIVIGHFFRIIQVGRRIEHLDCEHPEVGPDRANTESVLGQEKCDSHTERLAASKHVKEGN